MLTMITISTSSFAGKEKALDSLMKRDSNKQALSKISKRICGIDLSKCEEVSTNACEQISSLDYKLQESCSEAILKTCDIDCSR